MSDDTTLRQTLAGWISSPAAGQPEDRRGFLRQVAGAAAGMMWLDGLPVVPDRRERTLSRVGVQLYTVRREMQKSVEDTLERVAKIGYQEVEFAGYFGKSAREIRALLDANGLTSPSAHSADLTSIRTRFPAVLDDALTIGHKYVVCASLPTAERSMDGFRRVAEEFNHAGEQAARVGVTLGYHNHDFEFQTLSGGIGYDVLLSATDPKLVAMQMDLFWISKAGRDPLDYFAKYPGRFFSVHVKDMNAAGEMVAVGEGRLPFSTWFAQSDKAGIRHYFVEHDNPMDPMASITTSYRALSGKREAGSGKRGGKGGTGEA